MDIAEQKYRKVMNQYRSAYSNIISEYPISGKDISQGTRYRNLKYIASKAILSSNYPYYHHIYEQALEEIRGNLADQDAETRMLTVRLARSLPFMFRIRLIEMCENVSTLICKEITSAVLAHQKKQATVVVNPYGYQLASDFSEFLLSVFELSTQSQDIYFDVNQRIMTIFARFFQSAIQGDKNSLRNACEVLRNIFWVFGSQAIRTERIQNKLISKLISTFIPSSSFVNKQEASLINPSSLTNSYTDRAKNNTKLHNIILRCRQFEARVRARQLYGFCCLLSYLPRMDYQILDILTKQLFQILQNISECDVTLECFACLAVLLSQQQQYYTRNLMIKRWFSILEELSFKKEYLEYYILLLEVANRKSFEVPHKLKYSLAIYCLQLTKNIQQQYTRFIIYNKCCKSIIEIGRKSYLKNKQCNLLLNIFQYNWFIDRINQQNDLFKSEFLIALLHAFACEQATPTKQEVTDLIDLCHRLIDWKCTSKEETHIPTLKFAFDMYLNFLESACKYLQNSIQPNIIQLINRCNQPSIYFLFKFKLIATLLELPWYQHNYKYLQNAKINFQFIQDEIRLVMMPKNPKPIFTYEYSLTYDGEIQSRKEIEYIKIIMNLLSQIQKIHEDYLEEVETIQLDYHKYLNDLQSKEESNKELVNCLQTSQADYYFNECQKYFLLSIINNNLNIKSLNSETNLEDLLLYSHYETIEFQEEVNIFGPMSPVQLTIRLHPHPSYSTVYIHIKKNQWVQTQSQLKLIVSSGIEKKEVPFQSSILEIKIDRIGSLHFEVWKGTDNDTLLGSGNYKIRRKLKWRRVDHLKIIDGVKTKAYFKQCEPNAPSESYLSYYYGEPIMIHILKSQNEVIFGVCSKDIWNEIRDVASSFTQELFAGSCELIQENRQ